MSRGSAYSLYRDLQWFPKIQLLRTCLSRTGCVVTPVKSINDWWMFCLVHFRSAHYYLHDLSQARVYRELTLSNMTANQIWWSELPALGLVIHSQQFGNANVGKRHINQSMSWPRSTASLRESNMFQWGRRRSGNSHVRGALVRVRRSPQSPLSTNVTGLLRRHVLPADVMSF